MKNTCRCLVVMGIIAGLPGTSPALARQGCQTRDCPAIRGQVPNDPIASRPPAADDEQAEPAPDAHYRLRAGDVIELNFPFVPAFNHTIAIQPDGYVTCRAIGGLRVDGLTIPELTETLRSKYVSILRDPVITVAIQEFEKPYFIVGGEVERPGKYDLRGVTTVTQAVAIAGGVKAQGKHSQAAVFRRLSDGRFETKTLDLKKMLREAQLGGDLRLEPRDMIFIPRGRHIKASELTSSLASSLWILTLLR
jgi:polysaccharide biosynthesis/export protein